MPALPGEDALRIFEAAWGPFVQARRQLEPEGRWAPLRLDLAEVLARHNDADDGTLLLNAEYLTVIGTRGP